MFSPKTKSTILTILLVFTTTVFVFGALAAPAPARAQWTTISHTFTDIPRQISEGMQKAKDTVKKALTRTLSRSYQQAIRSVTYKLAQDTATWIASGGKGQKPLLFRNFGSWMKESGNIAAGKFLANLTAGWPVNICDASSLKSKLAITIGIEKSLDDLMFPVSSKDTGLTGCKLTEIRNNFAKAVQAKNFLVDFQTSFEPGRNDLFVSNALFEDLKKKEEQSIEEQAVERMKSGDFTGAEGIIKSAYPTATKEQVDQLYRAAFDKYAEDPPRTEDILVDTLAVFANTLSKAYMQKLQRGFFPFRKTSGGPDSEIGGSAGSLKALLASFDVFSPQRAIEIGAGREIDLLADMLTCPEPQYQTQYNCLLSNSLQQAVQQGLTARQDRKS